MPLFAPNDLTELAEPFSHPLVLHAFLGLEVDTTPKGKDERGGFLLITWKALPLEVSLVIGSGKFHAIFC